MKWKRTSSGDRKLTKNKSRPFLVLPLLDNLTSSLTTNKEEMPVKNPSGLKLFTKTWPPKLGEADQKVEAKEEIARPLTATLEKPTILNISLIGLIDMSTVRKEFLNISNLCRFPIALKINGNTNRRNKTAVISRPLTLSPRKISKNNNSIGSTNSRVPMTDLNRKKTRNKRSETSDSWEEDELSSISSRKSAKSSGTCSRNSCTPTNSISKSKICKLKRVVETNNNIKSPKRVVDLKDSKDKKAATNLIVCDSNNNNKTLAIRIPRKRVVATKVIAEVKSTPADSGASSRSSIKLLPEPCKTCGRQDQPERFHSHPVTPLKPVKKQQVEEPPKMKSTVQKPVAIKYKSKQLPDKKVPPQPTAPPHRKPSLPSQKLVHTPPNIQGETAIDKQVNKASGNRPKSSRRFLTCYLCGREFGTASLPLHEPKCLQRWERENEGLPLHMQRKPPPRPDHGLSSEEWNQFAWEASQATLTPCLNCGRTFQPDRLMVHQRSCKSTGQDNVETRTLRIGAVNIFANVSFTIGNALSGILFKQIGFYGIYSLALFCYVLGFTYGAFVVQEQNFNEGDKLKHDHDYQEGNLLTDFFDWKHLSETFKVAFKNGDKRRKFRICTIMVLCMIVVGPMHGEISVLYLFLRYKFGWNEVDYSVYSTFYVVTHMLGTLFSLIIFTKVLKVDDAVLGMISSLSKILAAMVYAFAPNSLTFYIGALIEIFNGTTFIAMRSIMSKLVSPDELGKINSLFGLSEALVPMIYGPLYTVIYKNTINFLPGMFFITGAVLTFPAIFIFGWLYKEHKRDRKMAAVESPSG